MNGPACAGRRRTRKLQPMNDVARYRIFLLSPAYAGGERARMILSDRAEFELARKLRSRRGAPIAKVFSFLSGLYFRGKIAYATTFARPVLGMPAVLVITPTRGLVDASTRIRLDDLQNSQRSTFRVRIRVIAHRSSETRVFSQENCRVRA